MWKYDVFNQCCIEIKKRRSFLNEHPSTFDAICRIIGEHVNVSKDVVHKWRFEKGPHPTDLSIIKTVENLLGVPLWDFSDCRLLEEVYSESCKNNLQACYSLMKDYLQPHNMNDDKAYQALLRNIDKHKLAIPENVYKKIIDFTKTELSILTNATDRFYPLLDAESYGVIDENGIFTPYDQNSYNAFLSEHLNILTHIERKLDTFASLHIAPILKQTII